MAFEVMFRNKKKNTFGPWEALVFNSRDEAEKVRSKCEKENKFPDQEYYVDVYHHFLACHP